MNRGNDYIKDISEIRSIMERSSRFMSLSGISGILAGVYALAGAYIAYRIIYFSDGEIYPRLSGSMLQLVILAVVVLALALGTGILLSYAKAKKLKYKFWDTTARRMVINLFIPLVTGGLFMVILFSEGYLSLLAPCTMIFYGLGLVNSSKYTYPDIRDLGMCEIALGLLSAWFVGYQVVFWGIGFGLLHIVYGMVLFFKYEK